MEKGRGGAGRGQGKGRGRGKGNGGAEGTKKTETLPTPTPQSQASAAPPPSYAPYISGSSHIMKTSQSSTFSFEEFAKSVAPLEEPVPQQQSSASSIFEEEVVTPKPSGMQPSIQIPVKFEPRGPEIKLHEKPKKRGTIGVPIKLRTNFYRMAFEKGFHIHQYDIELVRKYDKQREMVKNKDVKREMFKLLESKLGEQYFNLIFYDFAKNMYSLRPFPFPDPFEKELKLGKEKVVDYMLKIQKINTFEVMPQNITNPLSVQALELMVTHNLNYSCVNLRRSFFREDCYKTNIGFNLDLWRGAYVSVKPTEVGLTLNIDTANAAFLAAENVLDLAFDFYRSNNQQQLKHDIETDRGPKGKEQAGYDFLNMFRGREIKTSNGFRKKIDSFGPSSDFKFKFNDNGVEKLISISEYFKQKYNLKVEYPSLPCISTGRESYIPMEFCRTEIKSKKKLDEKETADIIKETAKPALERQGIIQDWAEKSNLANDPILRNVRVSVNLRMIELTGRVLPPPDIQYGSGVVNTQTIARKGQWDHRRMKFKTAAPIRSWIVLNLSRRVRDDAVDRFVKEFIRIGHIHGIAINNCLDILSTNSDANYQETVKKFEYAINRHKNLNLILVVSSGTSPAYTAIKTLGDLKYGISTQCVESKNVLNVKEQNLSNILLKINMKMGGKNFTLSPSNVQFGQLLQDLFNGPLMLFGADVTHPSSGEKKITESIAAVVGSLDPECCYYAARLYAQSSPKGQAYEMIHDLDKMVKQLLDEYFERNKKFPKKIVFFRDGVSDGQFQLVLRHELNKMREACQSISSGYKPAISFLVVQKRHHGRFFPQNERDQVGKAQNVPPGSIVDNTIVTPNLFDYYLCSHYGIQGTSRPCHYYLLHDDNSFTMDQIQILSYYLCHIYARCPRSVSYPAPAYYSHLAAYRCRDYNRDLPNIRADPYGVRSYEIEIHPNLKNRMFFI